jgi:hypothetical protein
MRGITVVVIVLGVLVLVMTALVIGTIAGRLARGPAHPAASLAGAAVEIPRGARIAAMTAGGDRLVLALTLPNGEQQLLVIDLASGARLGTIALREAP